MEELFSACRNSDLKKVQEFLEEHPYFDINHLHIEHRTLTTTLLHIAAEAGSLDLVKYFVEAKGADVNRRNWNHWTPFASAVYYGKLDVCRFLISKGVDVNVKTQRGDLLFFCAASQRYLKVFELLLENGVDVNFKCDFANDVLLQAAQQGHLDVCQFLFEKGVDLNSKNNNGRTALTEAAGRGHLHICEFLYNNGASINSKDEKGKSALYLAAESGNIDVMKYLCCKGAGKVKRKPTTVYNVGETARKVILNYLKKHGTRQILLTLASVNNVKRLGGNSFLKLLGVDYLIVLCRMLKIHEFLTS